MAQLPSGWPLHLPSTVHHECADRCWVLLTREVTEALGIILHFSLGGD